MQEASTLWIHLLLNGWRSAVTFVLLPVLLLAGCRSVDSISTRNAGFERLLDSVVRLDVWETTYSGGARKTEHGVGSGVIMTQDGYILTNAHVVNPNAERILVTLNNLERVPAELVGWDHWTDLAVLRLDMEDLRRRGLRFSHATFGDSSRLLPGETVYAVGTPNGLTRTVTRGIISNPNRYFEGSHVGRGYETGYFNTWLQTDAAINPGNSGGPLVLPDGKVIGINTRSYLGANNLSFAVPSNIAREVMETLIREGKVTRSYLGLSPGPLQDLETFYELEMNRGVLVQSVDPGSPAAEAGMRAGDIILKIDGDEVDGRFPEQLPGIQHKIAQRPVGSTVEFEVKRGHEILNISAVTELLMSRVGEEYAFEDWGMSVQKVSRSTARENRLRSDEGVIVLGAQPGFPAAEAGLRAGDIITKVNRESIHSLDQLKEVYKTYQENPERVLFEVLRNHQISFVVLKPR